MLARTEALHAVCTPMASLGGDLEVDEAVQASRGVGGDERGARSVDDTLFILSHLQYRTTAEEHRRSSLLSPAHVPLKHPRRPTREQIQRRTASVFVAVRPPSCPL
jgi:hypothetical protein